MSELSRRADAGKRSTTRRRAVLASGLAVAVLAVGAGATWASTTHGTTSGGAADRTATATMTGTGPVVDAARHRARQVDVRGPQGLPRSPVKLRVGDRLVVHLSEQAGSTGYSWAATAVPKALHPLGDQVRAGASRPGASSDHVFTFRADRSGKGTVTFSLRRPWESGAAATATLSVIVQK